MLIDIHAHLDICKNLNNLLKEIDKSEINIILNCGVDIKSNRKTLELSEKSSKIKSCLGIYPIDALKLSNSKINEEIKFIKENKNKIIAIGEVGIDLNWSKEYEKQKKIFEKFINLSKELDKPLIIHSRKAEKEIIEILEKHNCEKVIMHCFSGNLKLVKKIIENKWSLSIPCIVKYSEHFKNIIKITPIEQLFCETDSPFLHPDKEKNNSPINIIESYKKISEIKNISLKKVEKNIEDNYDMLFN